MTSGIYKIAHVPTGRLYIGSAVNVRIRWMQHARELDAGEHGNARLQNAWAKYGKSEFSFEILEECEPSQLLVREQHWLDTSRPEFNICKVAGSSLGLKRSAATRARQREAALGRVFGPETLEKMRQAKLGSPLSADHKRKISEAQKGNPSRLGQKQSPEECAKRSASLKGRVFTAEHRARISAAKRKAS